LKTRVAVAIVICIWIYNVAFNIPMAVWAKLYTSGRMGNIRCWSIDANDNYMIAARIINFFVPLIITWTSYIGIIYKFKHTMNKAMLFYFSVLWKL